MRAITLKLIFFITSIVFLSIGSISIAAAEGRIDVFVSVPPQAYFVERVGGDRVNVHVMVEPGRSPHMFEPTPKQLVDLARAKLYFAIGLPFERQFLPKVRSANPDLVVVHTQKGVPYRLMRSKPLERDRDEFQVKSKKVTGHVHGQGPRGPSPIPDPHIWLDPKLVKMQAATIAAAFEKLDPKGASQYRKNLSSFIAALDRIDGKIARELAPFKGRPFYVYHPAFGYFADAFGIDQISIEVDGKEPGGSELVGIIKAARENGARTIFVEPEFSKARARVVATAIGGSVVILDPLAKDYIANLESMAKKISQALAIEKK
jgi:zinc transport system substrate-binding protein